MSEHKQQRRRRQRYTFKDDTVQTARAIILLARTRPDAEPFIIDLLEGYAERARWPSNQQEQKGQEPRP